MVDAVRRPWKPLMVALRGPRTDGADGAGDPAGAPAPGRIRVQPPRRGRRSWRRLCRRRRLISRPVRLSAARAAAGVAGQRDERRQLPGLPGERGQHPPRRDGGRARRRRRARPAAASAPAGSQIARSTANGRPCPGGEAGHRAALQVDGEAPVAANRRALSAAVTATPSPASSRPGGRAEADREGGVGGVDGFALAHLGGDDDVAGAERRVEPAGDAEAEQTLDALADQPLRGGLGAAGRAAAGTDEAERRGPAGLRRPGR